MQFAVCKIWGMLEIYNKIKHFFHTFKYGGTGMGGGGGLPIVSGPIVLKFLLNIDSTLNIFQLFGNVKSFDLTFLTLPDIA